MTSPTKQRRNASKNSQDIIQAVPIAGMTCTACEVRVSRAIQRVPGVLAARVSAKAGEALVVCSGPLDMDAVTRVVEKAGYRVAEDNRRWLSRDSKLWRDVALAVACVVLAVLVWRVTGLSAVGDSLSRSALGGNLLFVVLLGVAASVSTCMALVGGIVMGISARFAQTHPEATPAQRLRPQAMFNLGRVVGFALLGALVGALGGAINVNGIALGLLMVVVAVVMGILGVKLTGMSPRLATYSFTLPSSWTSWMYNGTDGSYKDSSAMLMGAASFFLPCGFTQAVQVYALSTGSPLQAGLTMALFAVGTTPGLMGVGALSGIAKGERGARIFRWVGVVVIAFAALNLSNGFALIGPFDGTSATAQAGARTSNVTDVDGVQVARVEVSASGYSPSQTVVYADEPVKWEIVATGFGCASIINATDLGVSGTVQATSDTTAEFTLAEPGTYTYHCAMGMYQGSCVAIDRVNG